MKILLKLTFVAILIGCNNGKEPISFNSIEYSSYWGFSEDIKIQNTGRIFIHFKDYNETDSFYSMYLNKNQIDSLSKMVKSLYSIKIDTLYMLDRDSGRDFCLLIKSGKGHLETSYSGPYSGVKGLEPLFNFVDHLIGLSSHLRKSADSNFNFKTKRKLKKLLPPPPKKD